MPVTDGTILTGSYVKDYLEIEHAGDDDLLSTLIEDAEAALESYLQVPIAAAEVTEYHDGGTSVLFLERFPLDGDSVTVVDTQGTVDDATDDETLEETAYRVYPERGTIRKTSSAGIDSRWGLGRRRWKVTYTGGLDQHPDWAGRIKRDIRRSLRDLVAYWYEHREAGAKRVADGGGVSRTYEDREIPGRIVEAWDKYVEPT